MDRINHVKIVSPDPAAVDRFLREVVDIPAGWSLGSLDGYQPPTEVRGPSRESDDALTMDGIPINLPSVTGAVGPRLPGHFTPGSSGNWARCLAWMI